MYLLPLTTAAAELAKKQSLVAAKKPSTWDQVGGFLGQVLAGYSTASAPPASVAPAIPPPAPASSPSSLLSPTVIIAGAGLLAFLLLRRR